MTGAAGKTLATGWAVLCDRRRLVPKLWATQKEAADVRLDLLKPYPPGSQWHRRLTVAFLDRKTPRLRGSTDPSDMQAGGESG